jgi:hypothetical protein
VIVSSKLNSPISWVLSAGLGASLVSSSSSPSNGFFFFRAGFAPGFARPFGALFFRLRPNFKDMVCASGGRDAIEREDASVCFLADSAK